ncbi:MAG TPA: hypothetical protein VGD59_05170 [Acidisarcina sp.]
MSDGVTFDVGRAYPYIEQRVLQIIGKDAASTEERDWLKSLHETAVNQTSRVQCVGMANPVPFESIYQPTHLFRKGVRRTSTNFEHVSRTQRSLLAAQFETFQPIGLIELLALGEDGIIFAGPGWGKTTFMSSVFRTIVRSEDSWPVLISLRRPDAVSDLVRLVSIAQRVKSKSKRRKMVLLIDGYDEITHPERKAASEALSKYQAAGLGYFFLTCREYYPVYQLSAPEIRLGGFKLQDQYSFVTAFLKAFDSPLNPIEVVNYLREYGFSDLLSHPLMLTLACIVQTSTQNANPRSALKLLSRALTVLSYRWDEQKGIKREEAVTIDGEDRLQILRKIAHGAKSPYVQDLRAITTTHQELLRLAHDKADPRRVLEETAQFYGIFVPNDTGWEFVHRTLQDFLSAQHSVKTGEFARTTRYEWNARTSYCACLMDDCTNVLIAALRSESGLSTVAEILDNTSTYDPMQISRAIIEYFSKHRRTVVYANDSHGVSGELTSDFLRLANTRTLNQIIEDCSSMRTPEKDVLVGYAVLELQQRRLACDHVAFKAALSNYGTKRFTFALVGQGQVSLESVSP